MLEARAIRALAVQARPGLVHWSGSAHEHAFLASGGWTVIEVDDGGSSTFPELLDLRDLYRAMLEGRDALERLVVRNSPSHDRGLTQVDGGP